MAYPRLTPGDGGHFPVSRKVVVKAHATVLIGFIGNGCLQLWCFSPQEGESMNIHVPTYTCAISLYRIKAITRSIKQQ